MTGGAALAVGDTAKPTTTARHAKKLAARFVMTRKLPHRRIRHASRTAAVAGKIQPGEDASAAASASRHGRSGVRPAAADRRPDSAEYAGLGAGRGNRAVSTGRTR